MNPLFLYVNSIIKFCMLDNVSTKKTPNYHFCHVALLGINNFGVIFDQMGKVASSVYILSCNI